LRGHWRQWSRVIHSAALIAKRTSARFNGQGGQAPCGHHARDRRARAPVLVCKFRHFAAVFFRLFALQRSADARRAGARSFGISPRSFFVFLLCRDPPTRAAPARAWRALFPLGWPTPPDAQAGGSIVTPRFRVGSLANREAAARGNACLRQPVPVMRGPELRPTNFANGGCGEHRMHDASGIRLVTAVAGWRSRRRRSTSPTTPHPDSHGRPARIAPPMVG